MRNALGHRAAPSPTRAALTTPRPRTHRRLTRVSVWQASHFWKGRWCKHLKLPWKQLPQHARDFWNRFAHSRASDDATFLELGDPERQTPAELLPTLQLDFWVDNADFYDTDNMPGLFYFDSWDELQTILTDGRLGTVPASRLPEARKARLEKVQPHARVLALGEAVRALRGLPAAQQATDFSTLRLTDAHLQSAHRFSASGGRCYSPSSQLLQTRAFFRLE